MRGEHAPLPPGVVKVRLAGDTFASDMLVTILREHPSVEILTGPDRYSGDRQYLLVKVATPGEVLATLKPAPSGPLSVPCPACGAPAGERCANRVRLPVPVRSRPG